MRSDDKSSVIRSEGPASIGDVAEITRGDTQTRGYMLSSLHWASDITIFTTSAKTMLSIDSSDRTFLDRADTRHEVLII